MKRMRVTAQEFFPLTNEIWETLLLEGWPEELEDEDLNNYQYKELEIPSEDKKGLIREDDATLEKYNKLDIQLKNQSKHLLDLIDYSTGRVYVIQHMHQAPWANKKAYSIKQMRVTAQQLNLEAKLNILKPKMAIAAQAVYNAWEQDEEGLDFELGAGGICDQITQELADVIVTNLEVDVIEGGEEGSDHSWLIVYDEREACGVDIPPNVYESGGGYSWTKIPDVTFTPDVIDVFPLNRSDFDFIGAQFDIGQKLKEILATDKAYHILGPGTWLSGGCGILAFALLDVLDLPENNLFAIVDRDAINPNLIQHIIVSYNGMYLDGDGLSTEGQLLNRWKEQESLGNPQIIPYSKGVLENIPCPYDKINNIVNLLEPLRDTT